MTEASDFKKTGTKGYKAWRVLSSPGAWGQTYRNRERILRNYASAIIFPEQLLGLKQSRIFQVIVYKTGDSVTSEIRSIRDFIPRGVNGEKLSTLQAIRDYEYENHEIGAVSRISVGRGNNNVFYNHYFFSGLKDAIKYQQKTQAQLLG